MMTSKIIIANLKCGGCANTIKTQLLKIDGVVSATVMNEEDTVIVEHEESTSRETLTEKLRALGYPEATEENGLLTQLKSYASCMVGRMTKEA